MKFYYGTLEFDIPESVYYPREDSELMAKTLEKVDLRRKSALEIGCGSGFLSILMAKKGAAVTAVDINEEAVDTTKKNAAANEAEVIAAKSDLFSNVSNKFNLIIFNPPYLPVEEGETDWTYAGGKNGRDVIERFVAKVKNYLKPNGTVLLLISSLTGEKEVIELFRNQKMKTKIVAREKVPWEELIMIEACRISL